MAREIYSRYWDRMTFDEQKEYRNRKLSYFIRTQLYPYSPYYRKVFDDNGIKPSDIRSVEDLKKLPFTYKADISPDPDNPEVYQDFVLQPDQEKVREFMPRLRYLKLRADRLFKGEKYPRLYLWKRFSPVHIQFTTGKTGVPVPMMYARDDIERMAEAGRRIMELAGLGTRFEYDRVRVVDAMPFAPHLAFWMVAKGLDSSGLLSLHTGGGRILGTQRIISAVETMKATAIVGIPSYTYHLLKKAEEQRSDFSSVKLVLIAGERIPARMKDKIGKLLEKMGAQDFFVLGALGFTEARKSYAECVPDGNTGYHLYPDLDYLELVDPETGEPVDEGEDGELVYTCLEGQGTCLLRFRTGDFVRGGIVHEECPSCGRRVPRLSSDITRLESSKGMFLTKLKGTLVDQGVFFTVLEENPGVIEWQVEISKPGDDPFEIDVVDVYVTPQEDADLESLRSEIDASLQLMTEVKPNTIEFLPREKLVDRLHEKGGIKEVRVVDKRPEL